MGTSSSRLDKQSFDLDLKLLQYGKKFVLKGRAVIFSWSSLKETLFWSDQTFLGIDYYFFNTGMKNECAKFYV